MQSTMVNVPPTTAAIGRHEAADHGSARVPTLGAAAAPKRPAGSELTA